jgi:hypothetical protein
MGNKATSVVTGLMVAAVAIGGFTLILCLVAGVSTVIWYYLVNFTCSVFSLGYEITWLQAFAVSLVVMALRSIFKSSKEVA